MGNKYLVPSLRLVDESTPKQSETSKEWKEIRQQRLINSLNRINFQDGDITLNFKHPQYRYTLSLPAIPQPCTDENLNCIWSESIEYNRRLKDFEFNGFYFTDGLKKIQVEAELIQLDKNGVQLTLPKSSHEISARKIRRHQCNDVSAQLSQDGIILEGNLKSFSAVSFSVQIPKGSPSFHHNFKREDHVNVVLIKESGPVYSGICEIYRISNNPEDRIIVLIPIKNQIQRFKPKKHRSVRQKLLPSPNIIFRHPLTRKLVNLKALDISGAGFSVEESIEDSLLVPGLIIHDLAIELMNGIELKCDVQVIYRSINNSIHLKCGLTYLDMSIPSKIKLCSLLQQAKNNNSYVCTKVDLDELWDFFFESDFIYPTKYSLIQTQKRKFKEIYQKLYTAEQEIAVNFTYRDKGKIYGHMSTFWYYSKTWIIHHHAAITTSKHKAGLVVLDQIGSFVNEFHRQPSTNMDYVACYFRPENRFPNFVFGGVTRKLKNPKGCSIDSFAYFQSNKIKKIQATVKNIDILKTSTEDLSILNEFYNNLSGGLMIDALDLHPLLINADSKLNKIYNKLDIYRRKILLSIKKNADLLAIILINISEFGINMSELTNCIKVFVIKENRLDKKELFSLLNSFLDEHYQNEIPILIYPFSYVVKEQINYEKKYNFWILNLENLDDYFDHVNKLTQKTKTI